MGISSVRLILQGAVCCGVQGGTYCVRPGMLSAAFPYTLHELWSFFKPLFPPLWSLQTEVKWQLVLLDNKTIGTQMFTTVGLQARNTWLLRLLLKLSDLVLARLTLVCKPFLYNHHDYILYVFYLGNSKSVCLFWYLLSLFNNNLSKKKINKSYVEAGRGSNYRIIQNANTHSIRLQYSYFYTCVKMKYFDWVMQQL